MAAITSIPDQNTINVPLKRRTLDTTLAMLRFIDSLISKDAYYRSIASRWSHRLIRSG